MSTKNKKPSTASFRMLEIETEKRIRQLNLFGRTVKFQMRRAIKKPDEVASLTLIVGARDTKGEYILIFHGGGPPGPGTRMMAYGSKVMGYTLPQEKD